MDGQEGAANDARDPPIDVCEVIVSFQKLAELIVTALVTQQFANAVRPRLAEMRPKVEVLLAQPF